MGYLIVADWNERLNPNRIQVVETEAEAQALVNKLVNELPDKKKAPNAFYVVNPDVDVQFITVDPDNKTIFVDSNLVNEGKLNSIRELRIPLLVEADIQVRKHFDIDHANLAQWKNYRQALRDITLSEDLNKITWPTKPIKLP